MGRNTIRHRPSAVLLIHCPDRKGLVADIATFLYRNGANILHADQHQDNQLGLFFMRLEWDLDGFALNEREFHDQFRPIAEQSRMHWQLAYSAKIPAVAIFVSRQLHCLADLLYRKEAGELKCRVPLIVSNHPNGSELAGFYKIPFHCTPVEAGDRGAAEDRQIGLLDEHRIDLVVLARYMQVLSPAFVARHTSRIINVHHSFLPAFTGARPYHAAFERGVKLIGATSHYVTEALDEGPIIEQDVTRISHRDQVDDLVQKGRDLERIVLSRAVRWHLEHRILCYGNKTVVFD
jgi:formyltetrahydrofolate deformylase